jgi:tetratricopeptide (TPR) repeat protein
VRGRFHGKLSSRTDAIMKKLFLFISAAAAVFFASTPCNARNQWIKIESANFVLVGDARESDVKVIASKLEQFRLALTTLFPGLKLDTSVPTRVYVFQDSGSFDPFRPQYKGKTNSNVGGFFIGFPGQNVIALTTDPRYGDPLRPIFHEYEHALVSKNLGAVPAWLNEGLAEFFSTFYVSGGGKKASVGEPIAEHGDLLRQNGIWPLSRLFAVNHGSPDYNETSRVGIFYAESWALVHYLMFRDVKNGTQEFSRFIELLTSGLPVDEAFAQTFKRDYRTMEGELRNYLAKYSYPAMDVEFHEKLGETKDLTATKLPEAEMELYMGELLYPLGRFDEAATHLTRAAILDPTLAQAHLSLGSIRRSQHKNDEAEREYSLAIATDPKNYRGYLNRASLYSIKGSSEAALDDYRTAIRLKPDAAGPHFSLGIHYYRFGLDESAITEYAAAARLDDQDANLYRSLAVALLHVGRGRFAVQAALNFLKLRGWNAAYSEYMVMCAALGFRQDGHPEAAEKILQEASRRLGNSTWPVPAFRFLSGSISEAELIQAAGKDELVAARAFIGLRAALTGHTDEAKPHLEWVIAQERRNYVEYNLATSELDRIAALESHPGK